MDGHAPKTPLTLRREKLARKCDKLRAKINQENGRLFTLINGNKDAYRIAAQCHALAELGTLLETTAYRLEELSNVETLVQEHVA